eukprot:7241325-Prymnesium_polylepis.1
MADDGAAFCRRSRWTRWTTACSVMVEGFADRLAVESAVQIEYRSVPAGHGSCSASGGALWHLAAERL